ncbi:MAG: prepilin peptidase [Candidatus Peribacteraceae bacterium]|nr:prepilin peptidase [Candidatus Peribacteraceae bacterium]
MLTVPSFFFGLLGLSVGSFGNVLIHRIHTGESIGGRSHCPHCGKLIRWFDLIPLVSFLFLRGKCRHCKKRISAQYPLVELGSAGLFLLALALTPDDPWIALLQAIALESLFLGAVYDALHEQLPDLFTWPIIVVGAILLVFRGDILSSIGGALTPLVWFGGQWLLSRGKLVGTGDIFLASALGWWLGFKGSLILLFMSYISGAVIILLLLATRVLSLRQKRIPFGPFLAIGGLAGLLGIGEQLIWFVR